MQNPFKTGDTVLTRLKGKEIQAAVSKIWKNEVQVKTAEGELLWRTMYTVWRPGETPLPRNAAKATPSVSSSDAGQSTHSVAKSAPKKASAPRKSGSSKSQRRKRH